MKVALIYDQVNKFGGAERVLMALHEIWPEAPLYTAFYDRKNTVWSRSFKIKVSFLGAIPFMQKRHEFFPYLTPLAFESFELDGYDVVISISSASAKGVITAPQVMHVNYCLTPTRYLWSGYFDYLDQPGMGWLTHIAKLMMKTFFTRLRQWDFIASKRPDHYIAISRNVADRIANYYRTQSDIIYPPLYFSDKKCPDPPWKDYFLIVSRLVPYKKIDYVISSFNTLGWKLIIIGNGLDETRLKKMAYSNIIFLDANLTDEQLGCYYRNCRALIFPGEEDFGLTSIEAQAYGRPVIAYRGGGVQECIVEGVTGEFYDQAEKTSLMKLLLNFNSQKYRSENCKKNAKFYFKENFKKKFKAQIDKYYTDFLKNL